MRVLISAVEVGSVRSLIPICNYMISCSNFVAIDNKGFFKETKLDKLKKFLFDVPYNLDEIELFFKVEHIDLVLFSVNIHSTHPLKIARVAKALGIPTVHVLDYANNYRLRMELDGNTMFKPTKYFVPDEYSRRGAIKESIPPGSIKIVGQPAFSDLKAICTTNSKQQNLFKDSNSREVKVILFASEPVIDDQGCSLKGNPSYRGYTECDVIDLLISTLQNTDENLWVVVLPHPRQDIKKLRQTWSYYNGEQFGAVYEGLRGRELLPFVHGVVGMASTLLYEAWLVGKQVLSIQPGLINDSLRMLSEKKDIVFVDKYENAEDMIQNWLESVRQKLEIKFSSELDFHEKSAQIIGQELACIYYNNRDKT